MFYVPRKASNKQVLDLVKEWVDLLTKEDYDAAAAAVLSVYGDGIVKPEFLRDDIKNYRSPEYYPGVEDFTVTDWRTAQKGNPEAQQKVIWYNPNASRLKGAVTFDLPLNGRWSDLTAEFVFFDNDDPAEGYILCLEEIQCWEQVQREMEASEAKLPST